MRRRWRLVCKGTWTECGAWWRATGVWDSGLLSPAGGQFQMKFMQPGTFPYHCTIHPPSLYPGFAGAVVVTQ